MTRVLPEEPGNLGDSGVQERAAVRRAVRANPENLDGFAVIEPPRHGPAGDGHAHQFPPLDGPDLELAAHRGQAVTVVLADERIVLLDVDRNRLHPLSSSSAL